MLDAGLCSGAAADRFSRPRIAFWQRGTVQLGGAILFAILPPFAIAAAIEPLLLRLPLFAVSLVSSLLAIALGRWLFRGLVGFPGIRASYYVLPVFSSTFAVAVAILFMTRLNYSRPLLLASFGLALIWFYIVYFKLQRGPRMAIAVVPIGETDSLFAIDSIAWRLLCAPALPPGCTTVAADFDHDHAAEWERFLAECALGGVTVVHYRQLRESLTGRVQVDRLSENVFGSLLPDPTYLGIKSVADRLIALALLLPLLPVLALCALAVRLDSPGPAFFRQLRIGYRGQPFRVWKFRTMVHRAPCVAEGIRADAMTLTDDPRITRLGRHLRRLRIDEVPQILNIALGQMSWIGPRPEAAVLAEWYEAEIPFYRYRHIVRPGLSGWAQVTQGHVTSVQDVLAKLSYDFFYISRFNFWIDMLIVVRTIKTMLTGHGSR
ncbi:sugar transferase [Sphingomonas sp. OK281]|uniref:sugar transferase n=1 Tax=Sphingomonas sp. OK281 TaxID=1881067 RepID=UPI0008F07E45|nr:sugar transferase [Sphingomonas sp. OK281]SFO48518.1 Sugar transferase involved in LPS biosynthesis (colanic, teichoic acid) [Sphingomonas sp. OK281]